MPEALSRIAVTFEYPPDKLAVRITAPNGQPFRWAEDEPLAENVITGIKKSGEMPGGHKEVSGDLPRDPRIDWPDLEMYSDIEVAQPGGEVIFSGRLMEKPQSDGERQVIEVKAVGHQAALEDRKAIRLGIVSADMTKWGEPSARRRAKEVIKAWKMNTNAQVSILPAGTPSGAGESQPAALAHAWAHMDNNAGAHLDVAESWFDSGGIELGEVLGDFLNVKGLGAGDPNWANIIGSSSDDIASAWEALNNFNATTTAGWGFAINAARFFLFIEDYYTKAVNEDGAWETQWRNLRILGRHGLALQGEWPHVGFTAKQILGYAIPLYTYLEARDEDLEDSGYIIQQAWYSDPTDMASITKDVTKYDLLDWFVLTEKRFELRFPGTYGRFWQAYAGPSELSETGEDGSRLWDRIVVSYQDVDGSTRTVGYFGSGADVEFEGLQITDPDHPAVKAAIPREDLLALSGISVPERAREAGEAWLREANELTHAGTATLRGYIMDDKSVMRPVAQIMPGDWIRFPDAGSGGTGYRKIVHVEYDHDTRTATVALDAPPEAVQALLERFQAELVPLGL